MQDLTLVPNDELVAELLNRCDVAVVILKKKNITGKEDTLTYDRYKGDINEVAGLATEASIKVISAKLVTGFKPREM